MRKRRIYFDGDRALVSLAKGRGVAVIDADDVGLVSVRSWSLSNSGRAWGGPRVGLMHRVIMEPPPGAVIDHINCDPLDNRRSNLRLATRAQNARNRNRASGRSRFKGVHKGEGGRWSAQISVNGKNRRAGCYLTEEEAAQAYDAAALELHGEFARTNKMMGLL